MEKISPIKTAKVLIVEDENMIAGEIEDILMRLGYEVTGIASSGEEAIGKVAETHPDIVLMDIVLKGNMDGVNSAEQIKAVFDIPVVYLTAYADENILQRAKITEPYGYILKPFEERELHTNIEIGLYKHRIGKELKESQKWMREEKAKSEAIIEAMGDGLSIQDTNYRVLYQNRVHKNLVGDHLGAQCYEAYEKKEQRCEGCPVYLAFKDGGIHTVERVAPTDKGILYAEITASPLRDFTGKIVAGIELVRDITKRKLAEEAMRESEERYRNLIENAHDMIQSVGPDGRFIFVNKSWLTATGYTTDDLKTISIFDIIHPDHKDKCMEIFEKVISGETVDNIEATFISKDGRRLDVEGNVNVRFVGGKVVATQGIFRDITERKKMEAQILQAKQDWEESFNTITDMITVHDKDFNIILANKAAQKILGLPFISATKEKCYKYYHGTGCPPSGCPSCQTLITGMPASSEIFEPHLNMFIEIEAIPRFDSNHQVIGLIHVVRDITARKKAEEERDRLEAQLRHSQKIEAIGTLTAGISHEFNNILTAIIGYGEFLQEGIDVDNPLRTYVDMVHASAIRAANLTQGLLAYSRKQIIKPRPVRLNEIVKNIGILLSRLIGENIELRKILADKDLVVMADSGQIEQVLMNLATNARDAMTDGGLLTIETGYMELDDEFIKAHDYGRPGNYASISITDSGTGMDEKTRERIFEPFFTTKELGKGTGLGLAMVYGIIKQHEGYITVYSEPGKGTTFKIYLPLIEMGVEDAKAVEILRIKGGTETVLVAEDDPAVRKLVKDMLRRSGYKVITAEDGEDAVNKFKENKEEIQLILLDVIMPGKDGKEAYKEIKNINPDIKTLFLSGYTKDLLNEKGILEEGLNFIAKPVSCNELLTKVKEVLGDGAGND